MPYYDGSTLPAPPVISFGEPAATVGGTFLVATVPNRGGAYQATYAWTATDGATFITQQRIGQTVFAWFDVTGVIGLQYATLQVTETLQGVGSTTSVATSVPIVGFPRSNVPINLPAVATNGAVISASVESLAGMHYVWAIDGGTIVGSAGGVDGTGDDAGINTVQFVVGTGSSYTVTLTEVNLAQVAGQPTVQSGVAYAAPIAPTISAPAHVTTDQTGQVASVPVTPGMTYLWTIGTEGAIAGTAPYTGTLSADGLTNSISFTATAAGPSSVLLSCAEVNGASSSASSSIDITVDAEPVTPTIVPPWSVTPPAYVTQGGANRSASVAATSGDTYDWHITGGLFSNGTADSAGTPSAGNNAVTFSVDSAASSVTLTCIETNIDGVSSSAGTTSATGVPAPVQPTITAPASANAGTTGLSASVTANTNMTYSWTSSPSGAISGSSSGTTNGATNTISFSAATPGTLTLHCAETNLAGDSSSEATATVSVLDVQAPTWPSGSALTLYSQIGTSATLLWTAATDDVGVVAYRLYINGTPQSSTAAQTATIAVPSGASTVVQVQAGDAAGNWSATGPTLVLGTQPPTLPDAGVNNTGSPTLFGAVSSIFGDGGVQVGADAGALVPKHIAVLRGRVLVRVADDQGHVVGSSPYPNVTVSVLGHPEFGSTQSRTDGWYDLAVNGGGVLTLQYAQTNLLPVQRTVTTRWQDFTMVSDIVMTPYDTSPSTVDLTYTGDYQATQGPVMADDNGTRSVRVLFPPGTQATAVFLDGGTQELTSMTVRTTEFTVGDAGPGAMPASLPPTTAYTFAVGFTVDEAPNAKTVLFHDSSGNPMTAYGYVENFIGFPVGSRAPSGYYDPTQAAWVPQNDGKVVELVGVSAGAAEIQLAPDAGVAAAADLADAGFTGGELAMLGTMVANGSMEAGQSYWRMPIQHFTDDDWNWPPGPFGMAPDPIDAGFPDDLQCRDTATGSIIECQNRALGEDIPIIGTPYSLHYSSFTQIGRTANYAIDIPIPPSYWLAVPNPNIGDGGYTLDEITGTLSVQIGGQSLSGPSLAEAGVQPVFVGYPPNPPYTRPVSPDFPFGNNVWRFIWNGQNPYTGAMFQGQMPLQIQSCYALPAAYSPSGEGAGAQWAQVAASGSTITPDDGHYDVCQHWSGLLGSWDSRQQGFGGWTLSAEHEVDIQAHKLMRGDGIRQRVVNQNVTVLNLPLPSLYTTYTDGELAAAADGTLYFGVPGDGLYGFKDGTVSARLLKFGSGEPCTNGAVAQDCVVGPGSLHAAIAVAPDQSIYLVEQTVNSYGAIWHIDNSGYIWLIAGWLDTSSPTPPAVVDGQLATTGSLSIGTYNGGLVVSPDGTIYFSENGPAASGQPTNRVLSITADGVLHTVAGSGATFDGPGTDVSVTAGGDEGPAREANLLRPSGLALGSDGALYIADACNNRIRKVTPDGLIHLVGGTGPNCFASGSRDIQSSDDGNLAIFSHYSSPSSVAVASDNTVYIGDLGNDAVRQILPSGVSYTLAASGSSSTCARDCASTSFAFFSPSSVTLSPDQRLYFVGGNTLVQARPALQALELTDWGVASADGSEIYQFDDSGRHLKTYDALTGVLTESFTYDSNGLLTLVKDRDGRPTTISRTGSVETITGPYGQTTTLTLNSDGYMTDLATPGGATEHFQYQNQGLLTQMIDARGGVHNFGYTPVEPTTGKTLGFLASDQPAAASAIGGPAQILDAGIRLDAEDMIRQTAMGRQTHYAVTEAGQTTTYVTTGPEGLVTTRVYGPNATNISMPDGTQIAMVPNPDPRFGAAAPTYAQTTTPPLTGSPQMVQQDSIAVTQSDPADPLTLQSLTETTTVNGRATQSVYTRSASGGTIVSTTPAGRQTTSWLDSNGHVIEIDAPSVAPTVIQYNDAGPSLGLPATVTQYARTTAFYYDGGNLVAKVDPIGRTFAIGYDAAGRAVFQNTSGAEFGGTIDGGPGLGLIADAGTVAFGYDDGGLMISLTPPGQPAHDFSYNPDDLQSLYSPPPAEELDGSTYNTPESQSWDLDKNLSQIVRPDGDVVDAGYDSAGRLSTLTSSVGTKTYGYDGGQIVSIRAEDNGVLSLGYNGSLLTTETWSGTINGTVSWTYDSDFRVSTEQVGSAAPVAFQYDNDGLLIDAGALTINRESLTGRVSGTTLGGLTDQYWYDSHYGELTTYSVGDGGSLFSEMFERDNLGRITSKMETIQGEAHAYYYGYDVAGRLTDLLADGVSTHYDYDANGNRLDKINASEPGGETVGEYDGQDRLQKYGSTYYSYNKARQLSRKVDGDGNITTYSYDAYGNLRHVELPDTTQIDYVIDGKNRRVGKKVSGSLVEGFIYDDQLRPAAWLDSSGNIQATFVYGLKTNVPEYMVKGSAVYRLITDQVGSVRLVINLATGVVDEQIDYDEFGNASDSAPALQPFGFAGGIRDADTGLVRLGARDYDPVTGRWTSLDPLGFNAGDGNLFIYGHGDPVNSIDPTGRDVNPVCGSDEDTCTEDAKTLHKDWCRCITERGVPSLKYNGESEFLIDLDLGVSGMRCQFKDPCQSWDTSEATSTDYIDTNGGTPDPQSDWQAKCR